jgi:acetylglutamate kinase
MSIERFLGRTVVVKYGGNAMIDSALKESFAADVVALARNGIHLVVVHGGGPQINEMLMKLSIEVVFAGGFRVTDAQTMSVVEMVLSGVVQPEIVGLINQAGGNAVGLSGIDGNLLVCERRDVMVEGKPTNIGLVGDVVRVNPGILQNLLNASYVPVVSSFGNDKSGRTLNVNADTAAGTIAGELTADVLVMLTDVAGLYADWPDSSTVIPQLSAEALRELLPSLTSGMVPKMEGCLRALDLGAKEVLVIDGRVQHGLFAALEASDFLGTRVLP